MAERLLPIDDDPDTAGFWDAAKRRELVVRFEELDDGVVLPQWEPV